MSAPRHLRLVRKEDAPCAVAAQPLPGAGGGTDATTPETTCPATDHDAGDCRRPGDRGRGSAESAPDADPPACPLCAGTGEDRDEHRCRQCGGTGEDRFGADHLLW